TASIRSRAIGRRCARLPALAAGLRRRGLTLRFRLGPFCDVLRVLDQPAFLADEGTLGRGRRSRVPCGSGNPLAAAGAVRDHGVLSILRRAKTNLPIRGRPAPALSPGLCLRLDYFAVGLAFQPFTENSPWTPHSNSRGFSGPATAPVLGFS